MVPTAYCCLHDEIAQFPAIIAVWMSCLQNAVNPPLGLDDNRPLPTPAKGASTVLMLQEVQRHILL